MIFISVIPVGSIQGNSKTIFPFISIACLLKTGVGLNGEGSCSRQHFKKEWQLVLISRGDLASQDLFWVLIDQVYQRYPLAVAIHQRRRFGVGSHPELGPGFIIGILDAEQFRDGGLRPPGIILDGIFQQFDLSHFSLRSKLSDIKIINVLRQMGDIRS